MAQAATNDEPDPNACPAHPGKPSLDSPSYLVDDLGELYEMMVSDYLDVFGEWGKPIVPIAPAEKRRAVCAALGKEGYGVFTRAQSGKKFQAHAPDRCVGAEKQELYMGRMIWEFSKLPSGVFLVTRTARAGDPMGLMYQGHSISTSLDGPFVITVLKSEVWSCPTDPSDPCGLFGDDSKPEVPSEVRCALDGKAPCSAAGVYGEVYVTDTRTRASAHFGEFARRPIPTIKVDAQRIVVTAGECTQTAQLPLVAAPPQP